MGEQRHMVLCQPGVAAACWCSARAVFSWEGRSCASLCPGLLGTSRVLGSAATSASHLYIEPPINTQLPWVVLQWNQLSCSDGIPAAAPSCAGSHSVPKVPGLGPSSPSTRAGGTGGYLKLCPWVWWGGKASFRFTFFLFYFV